MVILKSVHTAIEGRAGRASSCIGTLALLATTFLSSGCQDIKNRSAEVLIAQFGNACVSKGQWTEQALKQTQGLIATLEELKKYDACKPLEKELGVIQGLSADIGRAIDDSQSKGSNLKKHFRNVGDFGDLAIAYNQLGNSTPALVGAAFLQSVTEKELEESKIRSRYNEGDQAYDSQHFKNQTTQFVKSFQNIMSTVDPQAWKQCLLQSPRAAMQLATQLLAVGGSSAAPSTGASLSAMGQLMNIALQFRSDTAALEQAKYETQKALMPQGIICALEAMTELYCQADDARTLANFQATSYRPDNPDYFTDPIFRGTDILTRRLPVINDVLRKIRTGAPPSDHQDAARRIEATSNVILLDNLRAEVEGRFNKAERMYNTISGAGADKAKEAYLFSFLLDLSQYLASKRGPFKTLSDDERRTSCMLALDPDPSSTRCPEMKAADPLDNYIRTNFLRTTSFGAIRENWKTISTLTGQTVDNELTQQITIDPKLVIVSMMEPGPSNLSTYETLRLIKGFLDDISSLIKTDPQSEWNPLLPELIEDTQERIRRVLDIIDMKPAEEWAKIKADDLDRIRLGRLYDLFALRLGVQFFPDRIKSLVEWDLNRRLRRGELPGKASAIFAALGGQISDSLSNRSDNLDKVVMDINNAQSVTQQNLKIFMDLVEDDYPVLNNFTSNALEEAKNALLQAAKEAKEPEDFSAPRPNRDALAELCLLSLIARTDDPLRPDIGTDVPMVGELDPCRDTSYQSVYAKRFGSQASRIGFPLTFEYNQLVDIFSGARNSGVVARARLERMTQYLRKQKAPLSLPASSQKQEDSGPTSDLQAYDLIFKSSVYGDGSKEDTSFARKVCTFHRFLRSGRIIEAMPALNPKYQQIIKSN